MEQAGVEFPRTSTVVNLSPADLKKEGASFDLPIAIGVLVASKKIQPTVSTERFMMVGEQLDGYAIAGQRRVADGNSGP